MRSTAAGERYSRQTNQGPMVFFPNCKINLGLRILRKRSDGYHDLETVFYPLALKDVLEIIHPAPTTPTVTAAGPPPASATFPAASPAPSGSAGTPDIQYSGL